MLLEEGIARLRPFAPSCQGVDVEVLIRETNEARAELLRLGPERMNAYDLSRAPKVRLIGSR